MRGDDQPALEPGLARAVGAQQFGHRLDRRLHRQHVQPGAGDLPERSSSPSASMSMIGPRAVFTTTAPFGSSASSRSADHAARFRRERRVDRQRVGLAQQLLERAARPMPSASSAPFGR